MYVNKYQVITSILLHNINFTLLYDIHTSVSYFYSSFFYQLFQFLRGFYWILGSSLINLMWKCFTHTPTHTISRALQKCHLCQSNVSINQIYQSIKCINQSTVSINNSVINQSWVWVVHVPPQRRLHGWRCLGHFQQSWACTGSRPWCGSPQVDSGHGGRGWWRQSEPESGPLAMSPTDAGVEKNLDFLINR